MPRYSTGIGSKNGTDISYNRNVTVYLEELEKYREVLTADKDGYKNEDLIELAYALKTITTSMDRKVKHAKDAYDFVTKCLTLTEVRDLGYSKSLNGLRKVWYDFNEFCKNIDSLNFYELMQSKHKKSRRAIFNTQDDSRIDYTAEKIESMLNQYENVLKDLGKIETNYMRYFKRWIINKDEFSEEKITRAIADKDGAWIAIGVYSWNDKADGFVGHEYRPHDWNVRISDITIFFEHIKEHKTSTLFEWLEKYRPEKLI